MKTLLSLAVIALLVCGCKQQHESTAREQDTAAGLIESRMAQFAASNNATVLTVAPTNWPLGLTVDIEDTVKRDGKPIVVELLLPDVSRDESGRLFLEGSVMLRSPADVRVEALVTTNMLPEVRASSSKLGGLWLVMSVESIRRRPKANDNEELVLRGTALKVESRPADEWMKRLLRPADGK